MIRPIFFCTGWFERKKFAPEFLSEAKAREVDSDGGRYSVLIDSRTRPSCIVEIVHETDFVGVYFLDELLRSHVKYLFGRQPDGRLFLTTVKIREFEGDTDRIIGGRDLVFSTDGEVKAREFDAEETRTGTGWADVSGNYSPYPEFGEYDDLVREERATNPLDLNDTLQ